MEDQTWLLLKFSDWTGIDEYHSYDFQYEAKAALRNIIQGAHVVLSEQDALLDEVLLQYPKYVRSARILLSLVRDTALDGDTNIDDIWSDRPRHENRPSCLPNKRQRKGPYFFYLHDLCFYLDNVADQARNLSKRETSAMLLPEVTASEYLQHHGLDADGPAEIHVFLVERNDDAESDSD